MFRLRLFMLAFCLALAVPLAYFVLRTERGLAREEEAQFRYFAETLFERMENELDEFVRLEETRAIDAYGPSPGSPALWPDQPWLVGWLQNNPDGSMRTPLATGPGQQSQITRLTHVNTVFNDKRTVAPHEVESPGAPGTPGPVDAYVMELAQQDAAEVAQELEATEEAAPSAQADQARPPTPEEIRDKLAALAENAAPEPVIRDKDKDLDAALKAKPVPKDKVLKEKKTEEPTETTSKGQLFSERYLEEDTAKKKVLGQGEVRVEQVPQAQAKNLAPLAEDDWNMEPLSQQQAQAAPQSQQSQEQAQAAPGTTLQAEDLPPESPPDNMPVRPLAKGEAEPAPEPVAEAGAGAPAEQADDATMATAGPFGDAVSVEVAPLQAVAIDENTVFLFRRVVLDNQVFRQGVVLDLPTFLDHLVEDYFAGQPMAAFARLSLSAAMGNGNGNGGGNGNGALAVRGAEVDEPRLTLSRAFPRPFDFLSAELTCQDIPQAAGRDTLRAMTVGLLGVMLLGMFAIHQSARVVVDHSRRRSQFVSSVTHELKTPLTNLRMYIEMLEQGIAPTPEREREYLEVLSSESARLSKLIDNVLEFSRLESRRRTLEPAEGDLTEVVEALRRAMEGTLAQEGFELTVEHDPGVRAVYDREAMVQVLMNLMENSLKFGATNGGRHITLAIRPDKDRVLVSLSDTGPGIPAKDLKRIFDDFYRVEAGLTRTTKGTGIGLALVRRFVRAMNGRVWGENNKGPGCTMVISLPRAG